MQILLCSMELLAIQIIHLIKFVALSMFKHRYFYSQTYKL